VEKCYGKWAGHLAQAMSTVAREQYTQLGLSVIWIRPVSRRLMSIKGCHES